MASKFWVGGALNTNWSEDTAGVTNWAATSGGAGTAAIPTLDDDVFFDANSGTGASVLNQAFTINSLDCTGLGALTLTHNAAVTLTIDGAGVVFKLVAAMTYTLGSATTSAVTFTGTSGTTTITSAGKTFGNVTINGAGGTFNLADALLTGNTATLNVLAGTFSANNQNLTVGLFDSSNATTRVITMGCGTWTISGVGTCFTTATNTNLTVNANTSTINFTNSTSTARTMTTGNGPIFNNVTISAGTGGFTTIRVNVGGNFNCVGYTGALTVSTSGLDITGNMVLGTGMTIATGTLAISMLATSGTATITSNGVTINCPVTLDGVGGTFSLVDALVMDAASTLTLTNGIFTANNQNVTTGLFASSNANIRTITMGSGTWTLSGVGTVWTTATTTNLTLTEGTSTIKLTDASATAKTFSGGGETFNNLWYAPGAGTGTLNFVGSNTFNDFRDNGSAAHSVLFTAASTNTFASWTGFTGNLVTIGSITAANHNLAKTGGGVIDVAPAAISRSQATPATTWYGDSATDGGNNSGWIFTVAPTGPPVGSIMLMGAGR